MGSTAITQRKHASLDRRSRIGARLCELQIVSAMLILAGIGASFSTTVFLRIATGRSPYTDFMQHVSFVVVGLLLACGLVWAVKRGATTRPWMQYAIPMIFCLSLTLVAMVKLTSLGETSFGATRGLNLGIFTFQPSELLKISLVMYLAQLLCWWRKPPALCTEKHKDCLEDEVFPRLHPILADLVGFLRRRGRPHWPDLPKRCIVVVLLASGFTAIQPDLGSSFLLLGASVITILIAGVRFRHFVYFVLLLFILGLTAKELMPTKYAYAMERVDTWRHPLENDDSTAYQITQSRGAIAEGRIFGKGFLNSDQKMNRLPLSTKDFVFPVIVEELGFVGGVAIIGLFAALAWVSLKLSYCLRDPFNRTVVASLGLVLCLQGFVNIGTTTGFLPLSGLTLPFFSEGGTSLIVSILALGTMYALAASEKAWAN